MTTAEIIMDRALALARAGAEEEAAISELLTCSGENRVAVVLARRHVLEGAGQPESEAARATQLLDGVLERLAEV
jgi:hypothetical protein